MSTSVSLIFENQKTVCTTAPCTLARVGPGVGILNNNDQSRMVETHKFILFVTIVARYNDSFACPSKSPSTLNLHVRQFHCHGSFLHAINGIPHPVPNPELQSEGVTAIEVVPVNSGEGGLVSTGVRNTQRGMYTHSIHIHIHIHIRTGPVARRE